MKIRTESHLFKRTTRATVAILVTMAAAVPAMIGTTARATAQTSTVTDPYMPPPSHASYTRGTDKVGKVVTSRVSTRSIRITMSLAPESPTRSHSQANNQDMIR